MLRLLSRLDGGALVIADAIRRDTVQKRLKNLGEYG